VDTIRRAIPVFSLPETGVLRFFKTSVKEKNLIFAFRQGFLGPDGVNQVAKTASVPGPLAGFLRGAFQSYFGKQSEIQAYFPQEPERRVLRGFPVGSGRAGKETEGAKGLFFLRDRTSRISGGGEEVIST
jgi:hypothetical protein